MPNIFFLFIDLFIYSFIHLFVIQWTIETRRKNDMWKIASRLTQSSSFTFDKSFLLDTAYVNLKLVFA